MSGTRELTVGAEDVIVWSPCSRWPHQAIRQMMGSRRWSALEILRSRKRVSAVDKLWLVLRVEVIPARILHEFACRCALRALRRVTRPDPRSLRAIAAKREWLRGRITRKALVAAAAAAWDAAGVVHGSSARAAARVAARAAASSVEGAAWAAARTAAWAAALAAANAASAAAGGGVAWPVLAAGDEEQLWQVAMLCRLLREHYPRKRRRMSR
jgi:hypothetical protein